MIIINAHNLLISIDFNASENARYYWYLGGSLLCLKGVKKFESAS